MSKLINISELSKMLNLIDSKTKKPANHVLRYWETEFKQLNPNKNTAGNRTYRQKDIDTILEIKNLLYKEKFTRVPYSGAFVGGSNIIRINDLTEAQTRSFKGDLIPPETFPKIVFEAKHYANFQWNALALGKSVAQLDEWISQAQESCEPGDKWLLIVKITRQGQFVLWDHQNWRMPSLDIYGCNFYKHYNYMEFEEFWKTHANTIKSNSN